MIRFVFDPRYLSANAAFFWGCLAVLAVLIAASFIIAYRCVKR